VLGVTFALGTAWGHAGHGADTSHIITDALLWGLLVGMVARGITATVLSETFAGVKTNPPVREEGGWRDQG